MEITGFEVLYENTETIIKMIKNHMQHNDEYKIAFIQKNINLINPSNEFTIFMCDEIINIDQIKNEFKDIYIVEYGEISQKMYDFNFAKNSLSKEQKKNYIQYMPSIDLPCLVVKK